MAATRDVAGRRYALAILEIARADGSIDAWVEAAAALEALTAERRFVEALQGDGMTDERFAAIVRQVLPGAGEKQLNLFRLLRRKGRLALGPSIASYVRELVDDERGVVRALVTSAVELAEEQARRVQERVAAGTGREVHVETQVDPSILGGLTIRIGDQLLDGSTRTRLHNLRSQLERAAV